MFIECFTIVEDKADFLIFFPIFFHFFKVKPVG
ncbi:hypothetical protein FHW88_004587 [Mucilaginibacter sp. SG538B]|nr:hypothetical protein [Mucilaginibacter sp. SG538B]